MNTCNRISNYIATKDNMDLAGVTNNSYVGIQYVQNTLPDAVILDLELHHGGGNGLFFLSDLNKLGLEKKPCLLYTSSDSSKALCQCYCRHNKVKVFDERYLLYPAVKPGY